MTTSTPAREHRITSVLLRRAVAATLAALLGLVAVGQLPAIAVGPASALTSTITATTSPATTPVTITANGASTATITVVLKDSLGANLTAGGDTVQVFTDRGTLSDVTDNNNGSYTATLTSSTTTGTATINGKVNGANIVDDATVVFEKRTSATQSTISASPASITADGTSTSTITIQAKNADGVNRTIGGDTIVLSLDPAGKGTLSAVTDVHNGTYTATYTSPTTTGSVTVKGTLSNGVPAEANQNIGTNGTITLTPGAASRLTSLIDASPTSITANGVSTSAITVTLKDANGNPLTAGGDTVTLSTTAGTLGPVTSNNDGTYSATLVSSTTVATANVSGTVNPLTPTGGNIVDTATVAFVPGPPSAATSQIDASKPSIAADGTDSATISLTSIDANGNVRTCDPLDPDEVTVSSTSGTLASPPVCQASGPFVGKYTSTLTATSSGTAVITGTVDGVTITDTATVTLRPAPDPATSTIESSAASMTADGTSTVTITVQLKDSDGTNLTEGGDTVTLTTEAGTLRVKVNNVETDCPNPCTAHDENTGTYTATLRSSTVADPEVIITGTVNGANITDDARVAFVAGPASAAQSQVSASPTSVPADGTTASTITVQLKDANGNNVTTAGSTVTMSTSKGTIGTIVESPPGRFTAPITSTSAGTGTIIAKLNGVTITDDATVVFVGSASTTKSQITASPVSIPGDGTSTSTITVQLKDANNNNLVTGGNTVTLSTDHGTLGLVTDNGNGSYTAPLTSESTSTGTTALITGTVDGVAITDTATVVFEGDASGDTSLITASPTSILADGTSTSTITVQLKDGMGNNRTSGGDTVVLSTTGGSLGSVTDNSNGTYTATLTSSTTVGSVTITGTVNGDAISDDAAVTFRTVPSGATSLITASPTSITANGTSTSTITVQLKDSGGTNLTKGGDAVALSTNRGSLSSVTDNNNGTYTATLTSSVSAGTATITGTVNGGAITDNATVDFIAPASPATSLISASPTAIVANGTNTSTITVQLKDSTGANKTTGGDTVTLATTRGTLSAVTDNSNGTYTATLTAGTSPGTARITGTVNGQAIADDATVTFLAPSSAATTTITASPTSITANGTSTSTITVQAKDAGGNNRTSGGDSVVLATDAGTLGSVTDNGNGTYTAALTSSTTAGTATITGTINAVAITDNATVTFTPGAASGATSQITAAPATITTDDGQTSTVTVQLKDVNNNSKTAGGDTVVLSTSKGSLGSVTDNANGTYTATLTTATTPGTATITGTVNGGAITDNAVVTIVPGAPSADTTQITASPTSIPADGASTSAITVQVRDTHGNNVTSGGEDVALATTLGVLGAVTDNGNGTYSATLTAGTTTGTATITGTLNDDPVTDTATVQLTPGAASGATSQITASPTTIPADGTSTSTITVQLRDVNANNLTSGGDTVTLSADIGSMGSVTDNGNGTYTATLTAPSTPDTALITGTVNGSPIADNATVVYVGGADAGTSTISASPTSIRGNGTSTSTITVQAKDASGNNLSSGGDAVTLATTLGTLGSVTDNANGTYTATLTSASSTGTAVITGTMNGDAIADDAHVDFTPVPSGSTSQITASPTSITANGTATSTITVQLKDASGTNMTDGGDVVTLSTDRGSIGAVTDNADGTYLATLTSSTSPGTATITGTVNGAAITDNATVVFSPPASVSTSQITASPSVIPANGTSTSTVTVQLKDSAGTNFTSGGDTVTLSTNRGSLGSVTDNGNGTYTATLTSSSSAGNATVTGTVNGGAIADTAVVEFMAAVATDFIAPDFVDDPIEADFSDFVHGVTTSNFVLRLTAGGANLPVSDVLCADEDGLVDCATGPVLFTAIFPAARLTPGQHYVALTNPTGATTILGRDNTPIPGDSFSFRASQVEEENSFFSTPAWRGVAASSAKGGSYTSDRMPGARAIYRFTGTYIRWWTVFGPTMGLADVYIDGVKKGTFNQYSSTFRYGVFRAWSLPAGSHVMVIIVRGVKGSSSGTDTQVAVDAFTVGSTLFATPGVQYVWRSVTATIASGDRYQVANLRGASMYFTFRGTGIDVYTLFGPNEGKMNIYVDGVLKGTFDEYRSSLLVGRRSIRGLSDTVHTLRVYVLGQRNAASHGYEVAVDRFVIL